MQGETLHFNCEYNVDDGEDSTDEDDELFSITDVSLLPHPDADHNSVYHCETENMDYVSEIHFELLSLLVQGGCTLHIEEGFIKHGRDKIKYISEH